MRRLGEALFVVAVPLFLVTMNVHQVAGDLPFYEREFAKYNVGRTTGLAPDQLRVVAQRFVDYVGGDASTLDVVVEIGGSRRALFNQRELDHMRDVQRLFELGGLVHVVAAGVLAIVPLVGFTLARRAFVRPFARLCLLGSGTTLGILVVLGGLSLLDFGEAFVRFHELAFRNDLWILDPSKDYLLMLFPEGFWFDATMRIASLTALGALAFGALGLGLRFWSRRG